MKSLSLHKPDKLTLSVVALTVLVIVLFAYGCLVSYQNLRNERQEQQRVDAQRMLLAFEAHSTRLFDYADAQLRAMRAYLLDHGYDNKWEYFVREIRAAHAERFTGVVHVLDRDGWVLYQSETPREKLKALGNMSDLDHYQHFTNFQGDSLYVGATRRGRVSGKFQYRLARPIVRNGVFDGLVVVSLLPDHLTDFYRDTSLGPNSTVTMMTQDQRLIARHPLASPELYGQVISNLTKNYGISTAPGEEGRVLGVVSSFDKIQRDAFYKNLSDYPLTLVIGVAEQDLADGLAEPRRNLGLLAAVFSLFSILICALVLRMIGKNRQLAKSESASRKSEALLQSSEARLKSIFDASPDALLICDDQGTICMGNRQVESLFGYSIDELLGQPVEILLPTSIRSRHPSLRNTFVAAPSVRPMGPGLGLKGRRKDGSECDVEISLSPIQTDRGLYIASAMRDITERKLLAAELEQHRNRLAELVDIRTQELAEAKGEAERANNAKSRFLAAASHDLRQPLAALRLYNNVLMSKVTLPQQDLVACMDDCIVNLSGLLTDLLDLSKLEAGVVKPNITNFSVFELLSTLESVYLLKAQAKGLRLRFAPTRLTGRGDPVLFKRLLGNLIENAIRYTPRGGIVVGCRRRQGRTWIEVWDSGIGIAPDQTASIFEEFKQLGDQARTQGSGLGLAIAAKTATLLGLDINVRSRPGHGSVFAIELPLGQPDALPAPPPRVGLGRQLRIALAEDNPMVRDAMDRALNYHRHQVVAAASGGALLVALGKLPPDIVVSDYRLSDGETGFDVITAVRQAMGNELPAIIITGDTDPKLMASMSGRGIAVLHKPLDMDELLASLEELTTLTI
jgi:PAS domain S-box-containing protein